MAEYRLLSVLFRQTNPYNDGTKTTYTTGDVVDTYFNDSTGDYKVYKNGVLITNGSDIPDKFSYSGNTETYYKSERIDQFIVCFNDAKLKYDRQSSFPYLTKTLLENHSSCVIGPVCDLVFTSLPVITNASSATTADGQISLAASSTASGSIQYKLNQDFAYGYGQTSTTFTGLLPGDYTIYARDSINCRSVITAKVGIAKSYGVKYRLEYINNYGVTHKTEILEKGFSGSVTSVDGGLPPTVYRLRGEGEKNKFVTVLASEVETKFVSTTDGQFSSIYTNDPEKYRLRHTIGGSVVWIGKVLTNQYEEEYINAPYMISILASDSLPELNSIPFLDDNGDMFFGKMKQITVLAYILRKIGFGLNIRSGVNLFASAMDSSTDAKDPLDQAYIDLSRYYLIQDSPTCGDVLKWILEPYNAQIMLWDNCWNIIRVEERIGNFKYREFDSNGVYVSNNTYTSLKELKNSTYNNRMIWMNRNQKLRIMPGYGTIKLIYNLGYKGNIFDNGNFRIKSTRRYDLAIGDKSISQVPDLTGFEIINAQVPSATSVGFEKIDNNNVGVAFTAFYSNSGNYVKTKNITVKAGSLDSLRIKVRYKIQRYLYGTNQSYSFFYIIVKFIIKYGDWWLGSNGAWYSTEQILTTYVDGNKANEYIDFEIISSPPIDPATGLVSNAYLNGKDFYVQIFLPNANDSEYGNGSTTTANIEELKKKPTTGIKAGLKTSFYDITGTYTPSGLTGKYIFYYELRDDDQNATSLPNTIRPNDSAVIVSANKKCWILENIQKFDDSLYTTIVIDYVSVEVLANGETYPPINADEKSMENENTLSIEKEMYHGSITNTGKTLSSYRLTTNFGISSNPLMSNGLILRDYTWESQVDYIANSADIMYSGYLRNSSGVGYVNWSRSGYSESKTLQQIFMDSYASQYNQPWRMINGDMYSDDTFFGPLNCLKETIDSNRIYMPVALEINFYENKYNCEFLELFDFKTNDGSAFTTGFSTGFNA